MKFYLKIILFTFHFSLFTQVISQNADCDDMVIMKDTIYHTSAISGYGDKREFDGNELENEKVFEKEENSIWYFIKAPTDGVFTFDIISENKADDWDFLLFEYKKNFCKRIEDNKIVSIRTNLSRSPITGLSRKGKENFVGAGVNANYSRPIHIHKGDRYVLVVNNPKRAKGKHTLILHYPKKKTKPKEMKNVVVEKKESKTTLFKLLIRDASTQKLLSSNVSISGLRKNVIVLDTITKYEATIIKKMHTVYINAHAKGYMLTSKQFKIGKNEIEYSTELYLEKIAKGKKVNLKNMQFYGNRPDFLPSARSSLNSLLSFMNQNSKVVIEVEGHVNGPGQKNSQDYKDLSYSRAYAVKEYLIKKGIDKERIDFKGYGNSQMLYPDPKSSYQESANRRVEIKILSNEYNSGVRNIH
ncbi:MAG: hypothetical protein COA97_11835 [Flavobacteriales bacterium]|nr:MAG: hypothetical protein COA97_11835 [Flavobacteriales bacterium]